MDWSAAGAAGAAAGPGAPEVVAAEASCFGAGGSGSGVGGEAAQVVDHVGPLLRVREAGIGHLGAGCEGGGLGQPLVQLVIRPWARPLPLQGGGELIAILHADRLAQHAVEVGADAGLAALVERVAGDAALRLGLRLATAGIGRDQECGDGLLGRGRGCHGSAGRLVDLDGGLLEFDRMHQGIADQVGARKGNARHEHGGKRLVEFQTIHAHIAPKRTPGTPGAPGFDILRLIETGQVQQPVQCPGVMIPYCSDAVVPPVRTGWVQSSGKSLAMLTP